LHELVGNQIENVVNEYDFCTVKASSIAFACALNAMESVVADRSVLYSEFETTMAKTMMVDSSCVRDLRVAIYELMNGNDVTETIQMNIKSHLTKAAPSETKVVATKNNNNIHSSPKSVASYVAEQM
jgi:hypothetical protein